MIKMAVLIAGAFFLAIRLAYPETPSPAERTPPPKATGGIKGAVRLDGRFERPPPLPVYKNRNFCGAHVANQSFLVAENGGIQNAVVFIGGLSGVAERPRPRDIILDNRNCAFVPRVQVASAGSDLSLLNSDPILHNVHARLGAETLFNIGLPRWRKVKKKLLREGIVEIECGVLHTWQRAYIVVTSSPHVAVTGKDGEFVIEGLPAGTYRIAVWHESLGEGSKTVSVRANATTEFDFVYRSGEGLH